ncbi:hypothetical protein L596_024816 [Steinernema carpocapsae]|uniref:Uncharacterized protein n=1 Tax=Steinernema carpocapsae TaxID=34508 RepID=A0A4U5M5V7_STECR|nr:hypothetical protein L596_024816 [Steinernema carpocapsae]
MNSCLKEAVLNDLKPGSASLTSLAKKRKSCFRKSLARRKKQYVFDHLELESIEGKLGSKRMHAKSRDLRLPCFKTSALVPKNFYWEKDDKVNYIRHIFEDLSV